MTFVAFEGFEGSGKSTQARMLAERLARNGVEPVLVREPGGTPLAEQMRELVLHAPVALAPNVEALLFQVARADLVARVIAPALAAGLTVIADRFELSTRCYQVAGRGLDETLVKAAIALATNGLAPDLYIVLDLDPADGRARQAAQGKGADKIERADSAFHERVGQAFRNAAGPNIVHFDAGRPAEALHQDVWRTLAGRFSRTFPKEPG